MPKNKWKIARTVLTKKPVLSGYNEYVDLENVLEDTLKCKGLDLCTYAADTALAHGHWKKQTFSGVTANTTKTLSSTLDATHAYNVQRYDEATGIFQTTTATAAGTTLTITDGTTGGKTWSYVIFYKATV